MGTHFRFRCSGCGYGAEVSGGPDAGMIGCTMTVHCRNCRRLYDVPSMLLKAGGEWEEVEPACPRSGLHHLRAWQHPGPCPRCGETMERGEPTIMWD